MIESGRVLPIGTGRIAQGPTGLPQLVYHDCRYPAPLSRVLTQVRVMSTQQTLYCFYTVDWEPLYVGVTKNPHKRFLSHKRTSWWPDVWGARLWVYPTRDAAEMAEQEMIRSAKPACNVQHMC